MYIFIYFKKQDKMEPISIIIGIAVGGVLAGGIVAILMKKATEGKGN